MICFYESNGISWRKQKINPESFHAWKKRAMVLLLLPCAPISPTNLSSWKIWKRQPTNVTFAHSPGWQLKKWTISLKYVHTCLPCKCFFMWWRNNCSVRYQNSFWYKKILTDLIKKVGERESSLAVFEVGFSQKKVAFGTLLAYRPEITQSLSHMAPYFIEEFIFRSN